MLFWRIFLCVLLWCLRQGGGNCVHRCVCVCALNTTEVCAAQTVWSCLVGVRNSTFHSVTRCEQLSVSLNVYGNHDLLWTCLLCLILEDQWNDVTPSVCCTERQHCFLLLYYIVLYCIVFFYPHRRSFFHCFYRERKGNREISMWERAAPSWPKYTCHQLRTVWNFIIKDLFGGKIFVFIFLYVWVKAWHVDGPPQLFTLGCVDEFLRSFLRMGFTRKSKAGQVLEL